MLLRVRCDRRRRLVVCVGEPALRLWVERRLLWVYSSCAGRDGRLECAGACVRRRASTYVLRIVSLHLLLLLLLLYVYILNALSWDEPGCQFVLLLLLLGLLRLLLLLLLLLGSQVIVVLILADLLLVKPCARRGVTANGVVAFARRSNRLPGITSASRNSQIDRLVG